ncbi:MAG TPA: DUF4870 domain-containing protein, partial [Tepidisphaeraceae bacterium]|nr:DUF4870 domain-containing protein [Tepidisphaeraceae bacterium]
PAGSGPLPYAGLEPDHDARTMAMLCHLLAIFTGFLGPLIIWLIKKDSSPFVNDQGKEALNFQLTLLIAWAVAMALACITFGIGALLFPLILALNLVLCILAAVKANQGVAYRYPLAIRLIK